jgi:hypothetical protein
LIHPRARRIHFFLSLKFLLVFEVELHFIAERVCDQRINHHAEIAVTLVPMGNAPMLRRVTFPIAP